MSTNSSRGTHHKPCYQYDSSIKKLGYRLGHIIRKPIPFNEGHVYYVVGCMSEAHEPGDMLHCGFYLCKESLGQAGILWQLQKRQANGWNWEVSKTVIQPDKVDFDDKMKNLLVACELFEIKPENWDALDRTIQAVEVDQTMNCESWIDSVHLALHGSNGYCVHSVKNTRDEMRRTVKECLKGNYALVIKRDNTAGEQLPLFWKKVQSEMS